MPSASPPAAVCAPHRRDYLARAVALIARDAPRCARAVAEALGPSALAVTIDGERAVLTAPAGQLTVAADAIASAPAVELAASGAVVLALIDGDDELLPAIRANRVRVRTPRADAPRVFDALRHFVDGCARASDGAALLDELRDDVAAAAAERTSDG